MSRLLLRAWPWAMLLAAAHTSTPAQETPASAAASIDVEIRIIDAQGRESGASDAVVWIPGLRLDPGARAGGTATTPAPTTMPAITQRQKSFEPRVTVVRTGSTVEFPNEDPIFHNVFSLSTAARFDMGLYRNGESREFTLEQEGLVPIYCNIHPQMVAYARVVDSDVFARTDADGRAHLETIPPGTWELRVWHEQGGEWNGSLTVPEQRSLRVVLDASSWRLLPHRNKYGQAYPPPEEDDDFRY